MPDAVVMARTGLLDALAALEAHLEALVLIGAQAAYLHTGATEIALAEFTTDWRRGTRPRPPGHRTVGRGGDERSRLRSGSSAECPRVVDLARRCAGRSDGAGRRRRSRPPRCTCAAARVDVDAPGEGHRGCVGRQRQDDHRVARRERLAGVRDFRCRAGGLLVAKLHKIGDRLEHQSRRDNKDAHDIYRLLRAVQTQDLAAGVQRLLGHEVSAVVTREALDLLRTLFEAGADAAGSRMAGAAEELVGDPEVVSAALALLAQDLIAATDR
ncbi:hypothetical protein [Pseudactinotalea terrae]|uniref:hypothetical protein n=1 Tax=Pseudactinotalea terrae TaxID=1743262 RepID=UPI0019D4FC74|nr:hypothetical protein [Pseudactinotalea terrae]